MSSYQIANQITFSLNGRREVAVNQPPQITLLQYLRNRGLTGAKEGCAEGECGACAVVIVREAQRGTSAYRAVNSCLVFLPMVDGQEVYTVEALAQHGQLNSAQQALADGGGSQCGYCTPGFVMSLFAEQYRPDRAGPCDPEALGGNLCRCTGYRPIRDAALSLGAAPADHFQARLAAPAPEWSEVRYASGQATFFRPTSLGECLAFLAEHPDARMVAGGTDLGVESNLRRRHFERLVSLEGLAELQDFTETATHVLIGAGLPLSELGRRWRTAPLAVRQWLPHFASPLLRNRATLGGNLATASPIGDAAPLLLALDAHVQLASINGERTIPLSGFFTAYRQTVMQPGEVIVSIQVPKPFVPESRFYKVAKRRLDDISTVAACFSVALNRQGRIDSARLAFGGVAATPLRATAAEEALLNRPWTLETVYDAQSILHRTLQPLSDHRGSAAYRLAVAESLVEKFWYEYHEAAACM